MKIICIGRNYAAHARELGHEAPGEPVFFMKHEGCLVYGNQPFPLPDFSEEVHHELELVVKIGKRTGRIDAASAHECYSEVGLGIDFTARDLQRKAKEAGLPWEAAKAFDHSAPVSEFLPLSELGAIQELGFRLDLNGKTVQEGSSANMVFSVDRLIAHITRFMVLDAGDLLFTGTPEGVGPVNRGDRLEAWLEGRKMLDFKVE